MDDSGFIRLVDCRVAIVGLGLMGGSLALALRGAKACREVVGVDTDPATLAFALTHHIVDRTAEFEAALDCDLLVLAAPVRVILAQLAALSEQNADDRPQTTDDRAARRTTVVLDLGSTKSQIVSAMEKLPPGFDPLGGHPMCGKEMSGIANAEADLFWGKAFVLTPLARTSPAALVLVGELIAAIGAVPLVLLAEQHDKLAAVTSHLPYIVAAALVRAAEAVSNEQLWALAASGFRDTSRLAVSDLTMMIDILLTNRSAILDALSRYRTELDSLIMLIDEGNPDALRAALVPAQVRRADLYK
ncbi:MAG: prephenate dehydrogenase [Anaerolineales bacterium]